MSDQLPLICGAVWACVSLAAGLGLAVWRGYTGGEGCQPMDTIFVLGWPLLPFAVAFYLVIMAIASPFYLAHWLGRRLQRRTPA